MTTAATLVVPGARLHYEVAGRGPVLVLVPGATGTAHAFGPVTEHLVDDHTVLTYDRRGFGRSLLDGPQPAASRLRIDADDLRRLAEHHTDGPATVFGASSGAIVALEGLVHHPSSIGSVVPFEAPMMRFLSDGQDWIDFFADVYDLYRRVGVEPALRTFRERTFAPVDQQTMARAMGRGHRSDVVDNAVHWFEDELRQYPAIDLDRDAMRRLTGRILPAVGEQSRGHPAYEATIELARMLGTPIIELPGGHTGYVTHPGDFAAGLVAALKRASTGS